MKFFENEINSNLRKAVLLSNHSSSVVDKSAQFNTPKRLSTPKTVFSSRKKSMPVNPSKLNITADEEQIWKPAVIADERASPRK